MISATWSNTPQRCYFCKSHVYDELAEYAQRSGYLHLVDGTNADDAADHRPGRQAAREHGVSSPLLEASLTKQEIRQIARQLGLPNWDKPAAACLSSRVPYGTVITLEMLSKIDAAEQVLKHLGFRQVRVRHHDPVARIEVEPQDFEKVLANREEIIRQFEVFRLHLRHPGPGGLSIRQPEQGAESAWTRIKSASCWLMYNRGK